MIYNLTLSNGKEFEITENDKQKIIENVSANFITISHSVINPSYIVSITLETEKSKQENIDKANHAKLTNDEFSFIKKNILSNNPEDILKINSILTKELWTK